MIYTFRYSHHIIICILVCLCLLPFSLDAQNASQQNIFLENFRVIAGPQARYPKLISLQNSFVMLYQVSTAVNEEARNIYITAMISDDGQTWRAAQARTNAVSYNIDLEPIIYSATVTRNNVVYVAVTVSAEETLVYRSNDLLNSFALVHQVKTEDTNVAPRLFTSSIGSILLFVNQKVDDRQQIVYITSDDGDTWSQPVPFDTDPEIGLSFLPFHITFDGRDYVVYQALNIRERETYQLYLKISGDGGRRWGESKRITNFVEPDGETDSDAYDNQRPYLMQDIYENRLLLAWERRVLGESTQIYLMGLERDGETISVLESVTGRFGVARFPVIFSYNEELYLLWSSSSEGNNRIILGKPGGVRWQTQTISSLVGNAVLADTLVHNGILHMVWQRNAPNGGSELVYRTPDVSVLPPQLLAGNFRSGERSKNTLVEFVVRPPEDFSGIQGYSWVWSRNSQEFVPSREKPLDSNNTLRVEADEDGEWYLYVRALDNAGNWSNAASMAYFLDSTPPESVVFQLPPLDENGFVFSNTFQIPWLPREAEENIAGYSVQFDYLGDTLPEPLPQPALSGRVTHQVPIIQQENIADGAWLLSVSAIDTVGNVGTETVLPLNLNKFMPETVVLYTVTRKDVLKRPFLFISGRGFDSNGSIEKIIVDADGELPYDYEFFLRRGDFVVNRDEEITNIRIGHIQTGEYYIGLLHPERGLYLAPETIQVLKPGIIKYGDFGQEYRPAYASVTVPQSNTQDILYYLFAGISLIFIIISVFKLVKFSREIQRINIEARSLITGKSKEQLEGKWEKAMRIKAEGIGLRIKFMLFIVLLVLSVVVLIALLLGRNVLRRQENILVKGLQERIQLLVEGQVTSARPALQNPQLSIDQLQSLASQSEVMAEAQYITLTGLDTQQNLHTVYATTDPVIIGSLADSEALGEFSDNKIDTDSYLVGLSHLNDEVTDIISALSVGLNQAARNELSSLVEELDALSTQAQALILQGGDSEEIARIDEVRSELFRRGQQRLSVLSGDIGSVPEFDFTKLRRDVTDYIIYKPVMDIIPGSGSSFQNYYRGTIRVGISTQLILDEIESTRRDIINTTLLLTLVAAVFGIIGAYVLATIIVIPITRIVSLVEDISAADDKSTLKGKELQLRGHDELTVLASSINSMTAGLVRAAEANKDLLFGKETQKAFIPLEAISDGVKRSYGNLVANNVEFFGYYEGAKGVSGDYFTYRRLSDRYYAIIKCDVAGKGIPAALIMVQVATVFENYFRRWTEKTPGLDISTLVLHINDIVAERQFKGRFAALTVGILDVKTGEFHNVNAGDNQLYVYRKQRSLVEKITIPGGPAAGTFSSNDIPVEFPQDTRVFEKGDVLLLYTDGLEEAKRLLRDKAFQAIHITQEMLEAGDLPQGLQVEQDGEEFSNERVHALVNAVQSRGRYRLQKVMNPVEHEALTFDFSNCTGTLQETVLAIVAAERIFRLYRSPQAGVNDKVRVDKVIDMFLQEHFIEYHEYFGHPVYSKEEGETEYREFSHLMEDEQFDDITMLAVGLV